jgi:hypothetical protein
MNYAELSHRHPIRFTRNFNRNSLTHFIYTQNSLTSQFIANNKIKVLLSKLFFLELDKFISDLYFMLLFLSTTGRGLSDNEAMAWRQLQLSAEQHKQLMFSTPQMASPPSTNAPSGLLTLHDMFRHHQQQKRRLSENDMDNDMKMPKLTPISTINTCSSNALPLSLATMPLISLPHCGDSSSELAALNSIMSHREKYQNQQYLDRLRRMNERGKDRQSRSRVNYEPSNVAKTVREELASRKQHTKNGKLVRARGKIYARI